jgi:hypothetical protein
MAHTESVTWPELEPVLAAVPAEVAELGGPDELLEELLEHAVEISRTATVANRATD